MYQLDVFLRFPLESGFIGGASVVTSGFPVLLALSALLGLAVVQVVLDLVLH